MICPPAVFTCISAFITNILNEIEVFTKLVESQVFFVVVDDQPETGIHVFYVIDLN